MCEYINGTIIQEDFTMEKTIYNESNGLWYELQGDYYIPCLTVPAEEEKPIGIWGQRHLRHIKQECALPGFVDSKNEEKTERNAGYLVVSHSGGGMLRQGTRKGIRRTPANRGMRAHWVVKGLDISEDVCHGMCP